MIDAVLFDLGDTIIDFGVGRREAELLFRQGAKLTYEDLRHRRQPGLPAYERYFSVHYRIMQRAYVWSKISRRDFSYQDVLVRASARLELRLTPEDVDRLARIWYQPISLAATIDEGVGEMLAGLRGAGLKLGIVSNTLVPGHCLDQHLAEEGLLEYFPVRIYSSAVRYRKPHPRIFEMALDMIGASATRTLFIGDLLKTDILGAKKVGMRTIWKPARKVMGGSGAIPKAPRRHRPDYVIPRVTHLPEVLGHFGFRWRGTTPAAPALFNGAGG